jgi:hypothetical protein
MYYELYFISIWILIAACICNAGRNPGIGRVFHSYRPPYRCGRHYKLWGGPVQGPSLVSLTENPADRLTGGCSSAEPRPSARQLSGWLPRHSIPSAQSHCRLDRRGPGPVQASRDSATGHKEMEAFQTTFQCELQYVGVLYKLP